MHLLVIALVVAFTLAVVATDLRARRIPNWLTVPSFLLAVTLHGAFAGWEGLLFSLLGFAAGFGILLLVWLLGGAGGGDVKMMGALGAWLGTTLIIEVFVLSAVATWLLSVLANLLPPDFFAVRWLTVPKSETPSANPSTFRLRGKRRRLQVPYAVPVTLSTWIVLAVAWRMDGLP